MLRTILGKEHSGAVILLLHFKPSSHLPRRRYEALAELFPIKVYLGKRPLVANALHSTARQLFGPGAQQHTSEPEGFGMKRVSR